MLCRVSVTFEGQKLGAEVRIEGNAEPRAICHRVNAAPTLQRSGGVLGCAFSGGRWSWIFGKVWGWGEVKLVQVKELPAVERECFDVRDGGLHFSNSQLRELSIWPRCGCWSVPIRRGDTETTHIRRAELGRLSAALWVKARVATRRRALQWLVAVRGPVPRVSVRCGAIGRGRCPGRGRPSRNQERVKRRVGSGTCRGRRRRRRRRWWLMC
mmetsp:Transcript_26839/g.78135  ORF Transcript_26839/g.78135 Transcript_26839/m.78135 type:complete len:212 (-) Transcript_26839:1827-2462(-)